MRTSTFNVLIYSSALALALSCASKPLAPGAPSELDQLRAENKILKQQLKDSESDLGECVDDLKECEASCASK